MDISTLVAQLIRTAAQAAAGYLAYLLLEVGVDVDTEAVVVLLVAVLSGLYAVVVQALAEHVHPVFGFLSIVRKRIDYTPAV
jgi:hypothetical protein